MIAAGILFAAAATASPSQTVFARDLDIREPVGGRVVAVLSDVRIASRVSGDMVVWGGKVTFAPSGYVEGNLSVFGGGVTAPAGQPLPVGGVVSTPGTLLRIYLAEMRRPPWEEESPALLVRGLRLIALSGWLAVSLALLFCYASPFARAAATADAARRVAGCTRSEQQSSTSSARPISRTAASSSRVRARSAPFLRGS